MAAAATSVLLLALCHQDTELVRALWRSVYLIGVCGGVATDIGLRGVASADLRGEASVDDLADTSVISIICWSRTSQQPQFTPPILTMGLTMPD